VSARFLLIDGYNLLHAAGLGRLEYGPGDLQRCRERLLRLLVNHLSPAELARALVVFDAREPPPDRPARQTFQGLRILFANPGGDADVAIQETLAEHSAPRRVTLVSSDHVLQQAARRHRADWIDSEDFLSDLERRRRARSHVADSEKPASELTPAESEHWFRYFGDLSSILAEDLEQAEANPPEPPAAETTIAETTETHAPPANPVRRPRRRSRQPPAVPKVKEAEGAGDLVFWMHVFGGLPEADELAQGPALPNPLSTPETRDVPRQGRRKKRTD